MNDEACRATGSGVSFPALRSGIWSSKRARRIARTASAAQAQDKLQEHCQPEDHEKSKLDGQKHACSRLVDQELGRMRAEAGGEAEEPDDAGAAAPVLDPGELADPDAGAVGEVFQGEPLGLA